MRILVVEDERTLAAYLRRGLEEQGHAVDLAGAGGEALAWAEAVAYDVILLDVMLPELDGISVCAELRRRGCRAPVLMLTAREAIDDRVTGLDAGADDYLVKPFALEELLARVRALGRRAAEGPRSPLWQVADLTLDTRTRRVERAGQPVELTGKEYAVLECLLREGGGVVSRDRIAERVWDYDSYRASNIVDVYIRNLRRKLDDPFELKLIHTVRGVGYRLSAESEDETV
jgi:DNA-binding response OmpR family regulator